MTTLHNPPTPSPAEGEYLAEQVYPGVWRCAFRVNDILWFTLVCQPDADAMLARQFDAERYIASGDQIGAMADAIEHLQRAIQSGAATMPAEALAEIRRAIRILDEAGAEEHVHRQIESDTNESTFVALTEADIRRLMARVRAERRN